MKNNLPSTNLETIDFGKNQLKIDFRMKRLSMENRYSDEKMVITNRTFTTVRSILNEFISRCEFLKED